MESGNNHEKARTIRNICHFSNDIQNRIINFAQYAILLHEKAKHLFPIGLSVSAGPISFSATLAPLGKDEADEQHNKYDSHIIRFLLYNSRTYALLANPESGLQLQSDLYILTDLLRELET